METIWIIIIILAIIYIGPLLKKLWTKHKPEALKRKQAERSARDMHEKAAAISHVNGLLEAVAWNENKTKLIIKIIDRIGFSELEKNMFLARKYHAGFAVPEKENTKKIYLKDWVEVMADNGKLSDLEYRLCCDMATKYECSADDIKEIMDKIGITVTSTFQSLQENQPSKNGLKEVKDPNLLYALAMQHFSKHEFEDAVSILHKAEENGSVEAMNMLGVCYENGYGTPAKRDLAIKYYTLAAEKGHADAQFNLGRLYYIIGNEKYRVKGPGGVFVELVKPIVPYEEDVLAEKWFRAAAEQGSVKAQFGLGELLMDGIGVERSTKNYEEGVNWMKKSAASGFKPAIYYVKAKKL